MIAKRCTDDVLLKQNGLDKKFFDILKDGSLYDLMVVNADVDAMDIQEIKVNRLHVLAKNNCQIKLTAPFELHSATLYKTRISNLNECVNLKSLNSFYNVYSRDDVQNLKLMSFNSQNDMYKDTSCSMLETLMRNAQMHYIRVIDGKNVVRSMKLQNLDELEFLSVEDAVQLTVDLKEEKAKNLRLINVKQPIQYLGTTETVQEFKQQIALNPRID